MKRLKLDAKVRVHLTKEGEHYFNNTWRNQDLILMQHGPDTLPSQMATSMRLLDHMHSYSMKTERINPCVNGAIDLTLHQFLLIFCPTVDKSTYKGANDLMSMVEEYILIDDRDLYDTGTLGAETVTIEVPLKEATDTVDYLYQLEDDGIETSRIRELFEDALDEYDKIKR